MNYLGDVTPAGYHLDTERCLHFDQLNSRLYISDTDGRLIVVSRLDNLKSIVQLCDDDDDDDDADDDG